MKDLSRLSLNQMTIKQWTLSEAIEGCVRHGVGYIGIWREKLAEMPTALAVKQLRDAGLKVSSLCRGGFFSAPTAAEREEQVEDNRRAIDACAAISSPLLVLVCGSAKGQTLGDARLAVRDALAELEPYAAERGVRLGVEPLHPMYAAERSVVVTLKQAMDLVESIPDTVGVVADVFHLWWDPEVEAEIARAGQRILGFHVSDWLVPLPDMLLGRGLMGAGVIDIRKLHSAAAQAGYSGPVEVEIFNASLWAMEPDEAMRAVCDAYRRFV